MNKQTPSAIKQEKKDGLQLCQVDDGLKRHFSMTQVHLCEAEGMQDFLDEDLSIEGNNESSLLVAVKMLREDANKNAR